MTLEGKGRESIQRILTTRQKTLTPTSSRQANWLAQKLL